MGGNTLVESVHQWVYVCAVLLGACTVTPTISESHVVGNSAQRAQDSVPVLTARKVLASNSVVLLDEFTPEEVTDIARVVTQYMPHVGNLSAFNLQIAHLPFDKELYDKKTRESTPTAHHPEMFRGYVNRGETDPLTAIVSVAPKKNIDGLEDFLESFGAVPRGEQRRNDFVWTVAHEIAHAISIRKGYGSGFGRALHVPFVQEWVLLDRDVRQACTLPAQGLPAHEQVRPEGFPTYVSSSFSVPGRGYDEIFADCAAYVVLDCHYGDNDVWLQKRLGLVREELKRIKRGE